MEKIIQNLKKIVNLDNIEQNIKKYKYIAAVVCTAILLLSYSYIKETRVSKKVSIKLKPNFDNSRIISNRKSAYLDKNRQYNENLRTVLGSIDEQKQTIALLKEELNRLKDNAHREPSSEKEITKEDTKPEVTIDNAGIKSGAEKLEYVDSKIPGPSIVSGGGGKTIVSRRRVKKTRDRLVFPVKLKRETPSFVGVPVPSGSHVKGKVLAGARVAQGKTIPFLIQLDYSYVTPNHKYLDLSGCFIIAKGESDLSTERLELQPDLISCVNDKNETFEQKISGWAVDDSDNNFALDAKLISKRGRVASMAFLASIVKGVSESIKLAQTTQIRTPLGGKDQVINGNSSKYIAAGGASEASNMVAQWYLEHAKNLLPTLEVGSGRDVWLVLSKSFKIPMKFYKEFNIKKGAKNEENINSIGI